MSYQPQTEAATSRFLNVDEGGRTLRIHINDCGDGKETVVMLHGSGPGATGWAMYVCAPPRPPLRRRSPPAG
ncbi:hypothetical protein ACLBO9_23285, partial [Klebsiella pneumoniae]